MLLQVLSAATEYSGITCTGSVPATGLDKEMKAMGGSVICAKVCSKFA